MYGTQELLGRSVETLRLLREAQLQQRVAWDVYPYVAGSTILNAELAQKALKTVIAWCGPYPEFCGKDLREAAQHLGCS
jgi:N-acyl-D-amino-acid deacylase